MLKEVKRVKGAKEIQGVKGIKGFVGSESILVKAGKLNAHHFTVASAYLDSSSDLESISENLEDNFLRSLQFSILKRLPLITIHPISSLAPICTNQNQRLIRLTTKINALIAELSKCGLLHLSVLANLNKPKSIFDLIPLGDLTISEPSSEPRSSNSNSRDNINFNFNSSDEILTDLFVSRKEIRNSLEKLLGFFAS